MLRKRIIPCLDIKNNRVVKGINFQGLSDVGDPLCCAERYCKEGADEIVLLDITATIEERNTKLKLVEELATRINIPFTIGGGVSSIEDAYNLLSRGADKISINSKAFSTPELISDLADKFGSQCVVVAIDTKLVGDKWIVYTHAGTQKTDLLAINWAKEAEKYGAGELLVTSMSNDGVCNGYPINLLDAVSKSVNIPVIASGGAGTTKHFVDLFQSTDVDAALAASVFHKQEIKIPYLKSVLKQEGVCVRI